MQELAELEAESRPPTDVKSRGIYTSLDLPLAQLHVQVPPRTRSNLGQANTAKRGYDCQLPDRL